MEAVRNTFRNFAEWIKRNPYNAGFSVLCLVLLFFGAEINYWSSLVPAVESLGLVEIALFFSYSYVFISSRGRPGATARLFMKVSLAASMAALLLVFPLSGKALSLGILVNTLTMISPTVAYAFVFVFFLSLISLGILVLGKGYRLFGYFLIGIAFMLFLIPYYTVFASHLVIPSDEVFITFADSKLLLLHWANPYSSDVTAPLLSNYTTGMVTSLTYTTSNKVVGVFNYPALFLFSSLPFYLASSGSRFPVMFFTELQVGAFLLFLLLVISHYLGRDYYKKPLIGAAFFAAFLMGAMSSPVDLLMLALIILAYVKLESRYSWVFLGLCLALQQLLWLPVALLVIYSINNEGWRKGIYNAVGSAAIFLLLDSYFILQAPAAFVRGVLYPIGNMMPEAGGAFGYLLTVAYGAPISAAGAVLGIAALFSVLAIAYANNKKLIPILGLLPFEFLSRNIQFYLAFFVAFMFAILYVAEKDSRPGGGIIGSFIRKQRLLPALAAALALIGLAVIIYSHAQYLKNFGLTLSTPSYSKSSTGNLTSYSSQLRYTAISPLNLSATIFAVSSTGPGFFKTINGTSGIDPTGIALNASSHERNISVGVLLPAYEKIYKAQIVLFNDKYAYFSKPV